LAHTDCNTRRVDGVACGGVVISVVVDGSRHGHGIPKATNRSRSAARSASARLLAIPAMLNKRVRRVEKTLTKRPSGFKTDRKRPVKEAFI
jgi:hypothetical protein